MDLTADVKKFLRSRGADLVGIGDLRGVEVCGCETGIETDLCGKCFAVCAYTGRYLKDALCVNSPGRIESEGSL